MKLSILSFRFLFCLLMTLISTDLQGQWNNINTLSNHSFKELNFPSRNTGYAIVQVGGTNATSLYKTEDRGVGWEEITLSLDTLSNSDLQSIYFVDEQTGFIVLRARVPMLDIFVLKTQNGGSSWADVTPDSLPIGYGISDVFFTDLNQGFVSSGERLYRTTNGGNSWTTSLNMTWEGFNEIHFSRDASFGIAGAWDGTFAYKGRIFTTSDGGQSWDTLMLNQNYTSIGKVFHAGDSTAFALEDQGWQGQKVYKTTNNGASWDTLSLSFLSDSLDTATDMAFYTPYDGYLISSNGYIFETTDGGQSWSQVHFGSQGLEEIVFNGRTFFAGGPVNTLLKYSLALNIDNPDVETSGYLYPNPCKLTAHLGFREPLTGRLVISDVQGKTLFSKELLQSESLSLSEVGITPGIYVIRVKGKKPLFSKLVVTE